MGRYPSARSAAEAHDLVVLGLYGPQAAGATNYPPGTYRLAQVMAACEAMAQQVGAAGWG